MPAVRRHRPSDAQWSLAGAAVLVGYVVAVVGSVLLMLTVTPGDDRTFLREFSVALGFSGGAIMGLQFLSAGRLKHLEAPFGIDAIYHFHRRVSLVALGLIAAHPVLIFIDSPAALALLNVFTAPWRARFAVTSLVLAGVLIALSYFRKRLKLDYEFWKRTHALLAIASVAAAVAHIELVGNYVREPWIRQLWIALPAVWAATWLWMRIGRPILMLRSPWQVTEVRRERGSAWTLRLTNDAGRALRFEPGQFAWLHLRTSPFAMAEHPFSFSSSAEKISRVEITIKELGDFTSTIGTVEPGESAWLDGPYGQFSVDRHSADRYVFAAGGVGITPVMSILETLADRQDTRPLTLLYGVPTLDAMTFRERLDELAQSLNLTVVPVLEKPHEGWEGESGFITAELIGRHVDTRLKDARYFVCGPEPMLVAVAGALHGLHVSPHRVHYEMFGLV